MRTLFGSPGLTHASDSSRGPAIATGCTLCCLLLTLLSTTIVGAGMAQSFAANRPFDFDGDLYGYVRMWHEPSFLLHGLPFSLTLLTILMAHEMGHYICRAVLRRGRHAAVFLPAPTLIGTMGAFIRIRSAILSKRILFDIGIAGPLAGFAVLMCAAGGGRVAVEGGRRESARSGDLVFGTPLIAAAVRMDRVPGRLACRTSICIRWRAPPGSGCWRRR